MTLLIRGPVESEIAVLSFRRSQASCAVPAAGGQERRPEPGRGQPGLRWASLALIFQEGQSQEPALPEVGRFEVFAYDGGRAGPGGVNEEGRLKRLRVKAELRGWGLALVQRGRRPLAAEPSPVASVLWLCRAEAAEARHPPESWLCLPLEAPGLFCPAPCPGGQSVWVEQGGCHAGLCAHSLCLGGTGRMDGGVVRLFILLPPCSSLIDTGKVYTEGPAFES